MASTSLLTDDIFAAGEALLQWHALRVDKSDSSAATVDNECAVPVHLACQEPCVVIERQQVCVLWKPPSWAATAKTSVNPTDAYENEQGSFEDGYTSADCRHLHAWLAQEFNDRPIVHDVGVSHGLVHRLDRDTSGVLLWAKSYSGLWDARLQFNASRTRKGYVALVTGWLHAVPHMLDTPLLTTEGRRLGLSRS